MTPLKLSTLLSGVAIPPADIEITNILSDSRKSVDQGTLFVCLRGMTFDAHNAVPDLVSRGVGAVVVDRDCGVANQIVVADTREALCKIWANFYLNPQKALKFIGVTGTNGKTTTTTVMKNMLMSMGIKSGLIGTCNNEIGEEIIPAERTTPEPDELFALLRRMADAKCEYVVMEVSSQGMSQKRLEGIEFDLAVFTNLTQDHLDVHGNMENYYQAKKLLFERCKQALINIDDEWGKRLYSEITCQKKSFSLNEKADYFADGIKLLPHISSYWYSNGEKTFKAAVRLPGMYNVSNTLAVLGGLEMLGFSPNLLVPFISAVEGVKGRCEVVETGRDFTVVIDYAHTPDAIENILRNVRETATGRIVCLFGCGGNRDAKKRPLMAKAAADYADFLVVTSDNPRNENPHEIITDILAGLPEGYKSYIEIDDRREAIFRAIKNAQPNDVIVLAGKGHEDYQVLANNEKIHFDEREVVAAALSELEKEDK